MKTKEYVKKYNLNVSDKFDHSEFVADLTVDFITLLEVGKSTENIKGFDNAVRAIRMKFDAINNKTVGCIPEKLWNYFFATVIAKMREELFPEVMKKRQQEKEERKRDYERRKEWEKKDNDFWNRAFFGSMFGNLFKTRVPSDAFKTLELEEDATEVMVTKAYRKLSLIHHPDKGGKQNKFIEITEAKNKCLMYLSNN